MCMLPTTNPQSLREPFMAALRGKIGGPYIYGGNGPWGHDCSGLLTDLFREVGLTLNDRNVQGYYDLFKENTVPAVSMPGQLMFYGDSLDRLDHVMIVLRVWAPGMYSLAGARGGNSKTTGMRVSWEKRALVGVVSGQYWHSRVRAICDPFA